MSKKQKISESKPIREKRAGAGHGSIFRGHDKADMPKVHIKTTRRTRKVKVSSGAFIAPSFIGVMAFFIIPFLVVIYYSLVDNPISGNFGHCTGGEAAVPQPVPNLFLKSYDGAGGFHRIDMAGDLPLQWCAE